MIELRVEVAVDDLAAVMNIPTRRSEMRLVGRQGGRLRGAMKVVDYGCQWRRQDLVQWGTKLHETCLPHIKMI